MDQTVTARDPASLYDGPASPRVLKPFHACEAVPLSIAAAIAGKSERTLRTWCVDHALGRRIGGHWSVSRVALTMFLDGDEAALADYHAGARARSERVAGYYRRLDLGKLLMRPEFAAPENSATSAKSVMSAAPT
jgi:hypothetical protein